MQHRHYNTTLMDKIKSTVRCSHLYNRRIIPNQAFRFFLKKVPSLTGFTYECNVNNKVVSRQRYSGRKKVKKRQRKIEKGTYVFFLTLSSFGNNLLSCMSNSVWMKIRTRQRALLGGVRKEGKIKKYRRKKNYLK